MNRHGICMYSGDSAPFYHELSEQVDEQLRLGVPLTELVGVLQLEELRLSDMMAKLMVDGGPGEPQEAAEAVP